MKRFERLELVLSGCFLGMAINFLLSHFYLVLSNVYFCVLSATSLLVSMFLLISVLHTFRRLGKARKVRLVFLGISVTSFLFAAFDFLQFYVGSHAIRMSRDPPFMWLGDIPFPSFLASLLLGGLFSLAERVIEIMEKKDI